jgi:Tol biopolymer transport system component
MKKMPLISSIFIMIILLSFFSCDRNPANPGAAGNISALAFRLAYIDTGTGFIHVVDGNGNNDAVLLLPVTATAVSYVGIDGRLAYAGLDNGNNNLYLVNADGTGNTQLTYNNNIGTRPSMTVYGGVFYEDNAGTSIYKTQLQSGNSVTAQCIYILGMTCVLPEIYYYSSAETAYISGSSSFSLNYTDLNGPGETTVESGTGLNYFTSLSWSPDNKKIAFAAQSSADSKIYIYTVNKNGGGRTAITGPLDKDVYNIRWHPLLNRIYYETEDNNSHENIFRVQPDGSGNTQITYSPLNAVTFDRLTPR